MEGSLDTERPLRAGALPPEIAECVAQRRDPWIFAYGSLMWDPGFAYAEAQPALLRGYHRSFCVYSPRHRGTPERPGIVLGLDRGGACKGIAYRVPAAHVAAALHYLGGRDAGRGGRVCVAVRGRAGGAARAREGWKMGGWSWAG